MDPVPQLTQAIPFEEKVPAPQGVQSSLSTLGEVPQAQGVQEVAPWL